MTKTIAMSSCLVGALLILAACHAKPPAVMPARTTSAAPAPVPPPPPVPPPRVAAAAPAAPTEEELFRRKSLDQLNAEHPLSAVFFDYDQNTLREDGRRALQDDARWLKQSPSATIRIDGHCDERGTGEYNLALGERRADRVRGYLCWSQNRRGHFVITEK